MRHKALPKQALPVWKLILAGAGVVTIVACAVYGGSRLVGREAGGPSSLTLHPERQNEILAQRRADQLREELNLSPEQTARVFEVYYRFQNALQEMEAATKGSPAARIMARTSGRREIQDAILEILTADQREVYLAGFRQQLDQINELRALMDRGEMQPLLPEGLRPQSFEQFFPLQQD